jgi:hypothetical protein
MIKLHFNDYFVFLSGFFQLLFLLRLSFVSCFISWNSWCFKLACQGHCFSSFLFNFSIQIIFPNFLFATICSDLLAHMPSVSGSSFLHKVLCRLDLGWSRVNKKKNRCKLSFITVPSGKPVITAAQNMSASSVRVEWSPPKLSTIHGEFLGFRLSYKPRDVTGVPLPGDASVIEIPNPNTTVSYNTLV